MKTRALKCACLQVQALAIIHMLLLPSYTCCSCHRTHAHCLSQLQHTHANSLIPSTSTCPICKTTRPCFCFLTHIHTLCLTCMHTPAQFEASCPAWHAASRHATHISGTQAGSPRHARARAWYSNPLHPLRPPFPRLFDQNLCSANVYLHRGSDCQIVVRMFVRIVCLPAMYVYRRACCANKQGLYSLIVCELKSGVHHVLARAIVHECVLFLNKA
jgi:hypothetical protein